MGKKKKKKNERDRADTLKQVFNVLTTLEIAYEDDIELNRLGKSAINKLKMLPLLSEIISK